MEDARQVDELKDVVEVVRVEKDIEWEEGAIHIGEEKGA